MGRSAAQQLQLSVTNRRSKNRIICDQITTAGPNALEKFCKILRNNKRQIFIAEGLEECKLGASYIATCIYTKSAKVWSILKDIKYKVMAKNWL